MFKKRTSSSLLLALIIHLIGFIILAAYIHTESEIKDEIAVDWVEAPPPEFRPTREKLSPQTLRKEFDPRNLAVKSESSVSRPAPNISDATTKSPTIQTDIRISTPNNPSETLAHVTTDARIPRGIGDFSVSASGGANVDDGGIGKDIGVGGGSPIVGRGGTGYGGDGLSSLLSGTGADGLGDAGGLPKDLISVPEGKLGAVIVGEGTDIAGHIRIVRLKHTLSDWWQDPTAIPSFFDWLSEHTRIRADMKVAGGALWLTDPLIMDSPLVFMTGHDKDIAISRNMIKEGPLTDSFSQEERAALRKYIIERKGSLFFDDCGFDGQFAGRVREEFDRVFPEYPLKEIPHNHEVYTIYYPLPKPPNGGDIFWGSENQAHASKFPYQRGVFINRRLAIIYNRKDYMCAMETMEIESRTMLRLRRSVDVHRFMTNALVYAMKYGGNVDRSDYR